jgi:hypothetical protein
MPSFGSIGQCGFPLAMRFASVYRFANDEIVFARFADFESRTSNMTAASTSIIVTISKSIGCGLFVWTSLAATQTAVGPLGAVVAALALWAAWRMGKVFSALAFGAVLFTALSYAFGAFIPLYSVIATLAVFALIIITFVKFRSASTSHISRLRRLICLGSLNITFFLMLFCPNFPWVSYVAVALCAVAAWVESKSGHAH